MCSNLLQGSVWSGPARGRKKGSGRPKKIKAIETVAIEKPQIQEDKTLSEFKRTIYFKSCNNREKTYLYSIKIGTYYHCSVCHDYHKVREIG